jgi:aminopeptidase
MSVDFDRALHNYAELIVRVALNIRRGQRLIIIGPLAYGGVSPEAAPLVRHITESAYKAGARYVEAIWGDEALTLSRFANAPRDSFDDFSRWLPNALVEHVNAGDAALSVYANDPDLLAGQPIELVTAMQRTSSRSLQPFRERISRNDINWAVVAAASAKWAAKVFPRLPAERQLPMLWETIARLCRLDAADPVAEWQKHIAALAARADDLNGKHYTALRYTGEGTALTIGLPPGHVWISARSEARNGVAFTANIPTEEVFTLPHKDRVDGTVRSTKPLSYGGTLIENFSLQFSGGKVVKVSADRGEDVLKQLVETDAGSARLGEVALVPQNSPVAQSGLLFYNTLFDENAASHVALGSAYKFTMLGGEDMDDAAFEQAGGNRSATHVDFMIGSAELDIDGVLADGTSEPLMRRGDWARPVPGESAVAGTAAAGRKSPS